MRELDCDFCGAAAAGAYEIGPAPPDRSPTDRRRLVLCDDCHATLSTAVEPLLERLRAAESGTAGATESGTAGATEFGTAGAAESGADESTDESGLEPAGSTSEAASDGAVTDDERARDTGDDRRGGVDPRAANGSADAVGGGTDARDDGDDAADETGDTDDDAANAGDDAASAGDGAAAGSDDEADDTGETDASDRSQGGEEPPQFRKVMRLLNNRSFPVDRSEFVDLAAGAYELEAAAVEESLAYAVERGVLGAEGGQLVRG